MTEAANAAENGSRDEQQRWEAWHRQREEELRAPYGWLSQTALTWLQPLGGFKARVPGVPGIWALRDGAVTYDPAAGEEPRDAHEQPNATLVGPDGTEQPIDAPVPVPSDAQQRGAYVAVGHVHASVIERSGRFAIRVRDPEADTRRNFAGIDAYPFDPAWQIHGTFEPYATAQDTEVGTRVSGLTNTLDAIGEVRFRAGGEDQRLIAFDGGSAADGARELFIIFRDPTNGSTTYGSGRFLEATVPQDAQPGAGSADVLLDFNRATNPPCAFSPYCTCPLAPAGNDVTVPVAAGERH